MAKINMIALVSVECKARTLKDLREFVQWCDRYRLSDEYELDWGAGSVFIDLSPKPLPADWIECGDHVPPNYEHDVIVVKHKHE